MKNIVLLGDSITDMKRNREKDFACDSYGHGYAIFIQGELGTSKPGEYAVYTKGIEGNRIIDVYGRIKADCWNLKPDLISILIGINDINGDLRAENGVELERYIRFYKMFIEDTKARYPNAQFILMEPFVLNGSATEDKYEEYASRIKEYAKAVKEIAQEYQCIFVPLQEKFNQLATQNGVEYWLFDGVHPSVAGAKVIANAWLKAFYSGIKK